MDYHEIMRATMSPNVYDGPKCDQHRPRWHAHADGDKDSDHTDALELAASMFPAGTKVSVEVPCCPECGEPADLHFDPNTATQRPCQCGFDWLAWANDQFS
jgi:hypothetical protein